MKSTKLEQPCNQNHSQTRKKNVLTTNDIENYDSKASKATYSLMLFTCHPYVIRMLFLCTRLSFICHSYVIVCHLYAIRMSLECARRSFACHSNMLV